MYCQPRLDEYLDTYSGKDILDMDGEPAFAEIAILKLLEADGWDGVWVDTYSRIFRVANKKTIRLSPSKERTLESIYSVSASNAGFFDVFA